MNKVKTSPVIWSAIERFSVQGISFILSLIIARLVTPGEYGLIAMLSIFMAIAQCFIDSGFGNALIQKKNRTETDFSTVFYFNICIAIILYIVLFFSAPLIAKFYNQPELKSITRFIGLNLIIQSFSLIQQTRLNISLNFKLLAKVSLSATIFSGIIGITLAYLGYGVWALAIQAITNTLSSAVLLWIVTKWKPNFEFSKSSFSQLFSFGSKLLTSSLLHTIYLNLYSLVIGKFYNPKDVGFYNRAYSISQYPSTNIVSIICRAVYPEQCKHQDDESWLVENFHDTLRKSCFIIFPLMVLLAIIAKPLVLILLTKKWLPTATFISILCLAYMWYPIMVINNQILNVKGRSDLFLQAEIIKKVVAILILFITLPFGVSWLCIGVLIYNLFDTFLIIYYSKKVINTSYIKQLKCLYPLLSIIVGVGSITYLIYLLIINPYIQVILSTIIFTILFYYSCKIFKLKELSLLNLKKT